MTSIRWGAGVTYEAQPASQQKHNAMSTNVKRTRAKNKHKEPEGAGASAQAAFVSVDDLGRVRLQHKTKTLSAVTLYRNMQATPLMLPPSLHLVTDFETTQNQDAPWGGPASPVAPSAAAQQPDTPAPTPAQMKAYWLDYLTRVSGGPGTPPEPPATVLGLDPVLRGPVQSSTEEFQSASQTQQPRPSTGPHPKTRENAGAELVTFLDVQEALNMKTGRQCGGLISGVCARQFLCLKSSGGLQLPSRGHEFLLPSERRGVAHATTNGSTPPPPPLRDPLCILCWRWLYMMPFFLVRLQQLPQAALAVPFYHPVEGTGQYKASACYGHHPKFADGVPLWGGETSTAALFANFRPFHVGDYVENSAVADQFLEVKQLLNLGRGHGGPIVAPTLPFTTTAVRVVQAAPTVEEWLGGLTSSRSLAEAGAFSAKCMPTLSALQRREAWYLYHDSKQSWPPTPMEPPVSLLSQFYKFEDVPCGAVPTPTETLQQLCPPEVFRKSGMQLVMQPFEATCEWIRTISRKDRHEVANMLTYLVPGHVLWLWKFIADDPKDEPKREPKREPTREPGPATPQPAQSSAAAEQPQAPRTADRAMITKIAAAVRIDAADSLSREHLLTTNADIRAALWLFSTAQFRALDGDADAEVWDAYPGNMPMAWPNLLDVPFTGQRSSDESQWVKLVSKIIGRACWCRDLETLHATLFEDNPAYYSWFLRVLEFSLLGTYSFCRATPRLDDALFISRILHGARHGNAGARADIDQIIDRPYMLQLVLREHYFWLVETVPPLKDVLEINDYSNMMDKTVDTMDAVRTHGNYQLGTFTAYTNTDVAKELRLYEKQSPYREIDKDFLRIAYDKFAAIVGNKEETMLQGHMCGFEEFGRCTDPLRRPVLDYLCKMHAVTGAHKYFTKATLANLGVSEAAVGVFLSMQRLYASNHPIRTIAEAPEASTVVSPPLPRSGAPGATQAAPQSAPCVPERAEALRLYLFLKYRHIMQNFIVVPAMPPDLCRRQARALMTLYGTGTELLDHMGTLRYDVDHEAIQTFVNVRHAGKVVVGHKHLYADLYTGGLSVIEPPRHKDVRDSLCVSLLGAVAIMLSMRGGISYRTKGTLKRAVCVLAPCCGQVVVHPGARAWVGGTWYHCGLCIGTLPQELAALRCSEDASKEHVRVQDTQRQALRPWGVDFVLGENNSAVG